MTYDVISDTAKLLKKNVNDNFLPILLSDKPYNVLKGGRNSFKSSVIALKLAYM